MNNETKIKEAILSVLADASNYPKAVQAALWGADVANLTEKVYQAVTETGVVEKVDTLHFRPDVDRVELIENSQRTYMNYAATQVMTSLQDHGKTLKIFLKKGNA